MARVFVYELQYCAMATLRWAINERGLACRNNKLPAIKTTLMNVRLHRNGNYLDSSSAASPSVGCSKSIRCKCLLTAEEVV